MTSAVTKEDIKKLITKSELKQVEKTLRHDILRVEERVENLEDGQRRIEVKVDKVEQRLNAKLDRLQNTLDGFVSTVDNLRTENEIGTHQTRELEKRVTTLESA